MGRMTHHSGLGCPTQRGQTTHPFDGLVAQFLDWDGPINPSILGGRGGHMAQPGQPTILHVNNGSKSHCSHIEQWNGGALIVHHNGEQ